MGSIEKPCVYCGDSCAGQARIKDDQGRYAHKVCVEARMKEDQSGAQADPVHDDGGGYGMDDLLADLPETGAEAGGVGAMRAACPGCGSAMAGDAVVCMSCGFNTQSGKAASTRVKKQKVGAGGAAKAAGGVGAKAGSLAMAPLRPVIGALIGGAIGAAVWAAVAYYMHVEIGFLASGVGAVCGMGALSGTGGGGGLWSGSVAVVVAFASIIMGKVIVFDIYQQQAASEMESIAETVFLEFDPTEHTQEDMLQFLADDIVFQKLGEGETIEWPDPEITVHFAYFPDDYPIGVVRETRRAYNAMSQRDKIKLADTLTATWFARSFADEIIAEREDSGQDVDWPDPSVGWDLALYPYEYPADIVEIADTRYSELSEDERAEVAERIAQETQEEFAAYADSMRHLDPDTAADAIVDSLDFFDAIWGILALVAAWGIGSGGSID